MTLHRPTHRHLDGLQDENLKQRWAARLEEVSQGGLVTAGPDNDPLRPRPPRLGQKRHHTGPAGQAELCELQNLGLPDVAVIRQRDGPMRLCSDGDGDGRQGRRAQVCQQLDEPRQVGCLLVEDDVGQSERLQFRALGQRAECVLSL